MILSKFIPEIKIHPLQYSPKIGDKWQYTDNNYIDNRNIIWIILNIDNGYIFYKSYPKSRTLDRMPIERFMELVKTNKIKYK
jgi:hypothetical protein